MIALDVRRWHYQNLLIIYLKFIATGVEGVQKKKKNESVCNFIGLKNNKSHYQCNSCKIRWLKPLDGIIKKFLNTYQFCNDDIKRLMILKKVFILISTWIVGKDLMKQHFLIKKVFTENKIWKILLMKIIYILKRYLNKLK